MVFPCPCPCPWEWGGIFHNLYTGLCAVKCQKPLISWTKHKQWINWMVKWALSNLDASKFDHVPRSLGKTQRVRLCVSDECSMCTDCGDVLTGWWGMLVTMCLFCPVACYGVLWGWVHNRPCEEHQREHTQGRLDSLHLQRNPKGKKKGVSVVSRAWCCVSIFIFLARNISLH